MNLLDTLFGGQRQRALGWLLLHPDEMVHVRELSRLTGASAGSLHRELSRLAETGLLLRSTRGNQVLYQANRACPVFNELASLFRKTGGLTEVLRLALQPLAAQIEQALVFGSVARGEETSYSDVDVLIIGQVGFADVVAALYEAQTTLGREINPVVYAPAEWQARLQRNDPFAREISTHPTLPLLGEPHDLGQSALDTQAATPNAG